MASCSLLRGTLRVVRLSPRIGKSLFCQKRGKDLNCESVNRNAGFIFHSRSFASDANTFDPYKVLGIEPGASSDEIRNAYIRLSKKYHPDRNPGNEEAEEMFIKLTNAYRVIMEKIVHRPDETSEGEKTVEKEYDFTISPLGVETEPSDLRTSRDAFKSLVKLLCLIFIAHFALLSLSSGFPDFIEKYSDSRSGKSEKRLNDEAAERIRSAVIREHRKQQELEKLYASSGVRR